MRPRRNKAKLEAATLLERFPNQRLPVKVERLAEELGATITYDRFDDDESVSAMLYRDDKRVVIGVNSCHPITRQRFSIAHELGHLLLHEGKLYVDRSARINFRDSRSSQAIDPEEIEANIFAAELLMPERVVRSESHKIVESGVEAPEEFVRKMADKFKVSPKAMGFRLENLHILVSMDD